MHQKATIHTVKDVQNIIW